MCASLALARTADAAAAVRISGALAAGSLLTRTASAGGGPGGGGGGLTAADDDDDAFLFRQMCWTLGIVVFIALIAA